MDNRPIRHLKTFAGFKYFLHGRSISFINLKEISFCGLNLGMTGLGTIVNSIAIIAGSLLGLLIGQKLPQRIHNIFIKAAGLITLGIGIKMFLETKDMIVVFIGLFIGAFLGEMINIEERLESIGLKLKALIKTDSKTFLEGFLTTSIIYCVGPMAIIGAIADGLNRQHEVLFAKSLLDGVVSIAFTSSLGIGVLFSAASVFVYQGIITIVAIFFGNFLTPAMTAEITATGGLLILGIGINLAASLDGGKRVPVGNILPAIIITPLMIWLRQLIGI